MWINDQGDKYVFQPTTPRLCIRAQTSITFNDSENTQKNKLILNKITLNTIYYKWKYITEMHLFLGTYEPKSDLLNA